MKFNQLYVVVFTACLLMASGSFSLDVSAQNNEPLSDAQINEALLERIDSAELSSIEKIRLLHEMMKRMVEQNPEFSADGSFKYMRCLEEQLGEGSYLKLLQKLDLDHSHHEADKLHKKVQQICAAGQNKKASQHYAYSQDQIMKKLMSPREQKAHEHCNQLSPDLGTDVDICVKQPKIGTELP